MTSEAIVFLPWLRLREPIELYDLLFCPIGQKVGFANLPEYVVNKVQLIASSYSDRAGNQVPDFTMVLNQDKNKSHNLTTEELRSAREAASLLFFCSWSLNEYYRIGDYSNSSMFNLVSQRF
jgi:hypothetical protein